MQPFNSHLLCSIEVLIIDTAIFNIGHCYKREYTTLSCVSVVKNLDKLRLGKILDDLCESCNVNIVRQVLKVELSVRMRIKISNCIILLFQFDGDGFWQDFESSRAVVRGEQEAVFWS